jgi:hypothetical protein
MAGFSYFISITGDCSNSNSGAISILPTGGTPPYSVEWVNPYLGSNTAILQPSVRTNLSAGTYSLRINDSTLPINSEFLVNIPVSDGVCASIVSVANTTCSLNNGSVTAQTDSSYSSTNFYLYDGSSNYITSAITTLSTVIFNSLSAGTYYIIAQDLGGCTGQTQYFVVQESSPFDFGLYVVPNAACGGSPIGKIFVTGQTGTPPYSYIWNNGEVTSVITGLTSGNYSVTVTDYYGCSVTKEGTVGQVSPVGFGSWEVDTPSCFGNNGVLTLTVTGGTAPYYYSASTGYVEISYSQTFVLGNLSPGDYSVQVTDAGLCSFVASTQILSPSSFSSVQVTGANSTCNSSNGSITITVTNGTFPFTYTLIYPTGDSQIISSNLTSYIFDNLSGGTYSVFVEDATSCSYNQIVTIVTENKFTITTSVIPSTGGLNNAQITVTKSSGGTAPFDYSLDDDVDIIDTVASATTFTNVSQGYHLISVTDADGCVQSQGVFIEYSTPLLFSLYQVSCNTGNEGKITAFISSGTPPFIFNWSNNVIGNPQEITVTGLTAGTYSLTITDASGVSSTKTTEITCQELYASYQIYVMGSEEFQIDTGVKCGLLQLMNEGYQDITNDNDTCSLISAIFQTKVSVEPMGTILSDQFFTATTINQAPADNLWYDSIISLVSSIAGVTSVSIDPFTNQITIQTNEGSSIQNQQISVELVIIYDTICVN